MKRKIFILFSLSALLCAGVEAKGTKAISANDFLNSIGACSSVSRRGENLNETIENVKYTGLRWWEGNTMRFHKHLVSLTAE